MLAGGASVPLLTALQKAACGWSGEDYSAGGLAELAWGLASCGQPVPEGCRQLLQAALQDGGVGADAEALGLHQLAAAGQQQAQQHQQQEQQVGQRQGAQPQHVQQHVHPASADQEERPQAGAAGPATQQQDAQRAVGQAWGQARRPRDWQAWFAGTPAKQVSLLLWSAAQLGCRPSEGCLQAAAAALLRGRGLARLSSKVGDGMGCPGCGS